MALTKPERNNCVTRRELLGMIYGVREFRAYLAGTRFTIWMDHSALRWLLEAKEHKGQMARQIQELGMYEFQVEYRPGKKHRNADGLLRLPCKQCYRNEWRMRQNLLGWWPPSPGTRMDGKTSARGNEWTSVLGCASEPGVRLSGGAGSNLTVTDDGWVSPPGSIVNP